MTHERQPEVAAALPARGPARVHLGPAPGCRAHAAAGRLPVPRVALAHDRAVVGDDVEALWAGGDHARAAGGGRRCVLDLPDLPLRARIGQAQEAGVALE